MNVLMNLLWCLFGGLVSSILWALFGLIWCLTIVGIPFGVICFKMAGLTLAPFGKEVNYGGGALSLIADVLWIVLTGCELAIVHLVIGCILCITIVGIPFGLQHFKLAFVALVPFGSKYTKAF